MHNDIAYLCNYLLRFPEKPSFAYLQRLSSKFPNLKHSAWFEKSGNAYIAHSKLKGLLFWIPNPVEGEAIYASCGIPLMPQSDCELTLQAADCLRNRFKNILHASGAKVLLSKRTANNRRVSLLTQIFPEAKFIHIIRDGRSVAKSLLNVPWWNDHTLYWAGKTPGQMIAEGVPSVELAARNWVEEMNSLEKGIVHIPNDALFEVKYNDLLENPTGKLKQITDFIGVRSGAVSGFWEAVECLQLRPRKEEWERIWTQNEFEKIMELQENALKRWGFV